MNPTREEALFAAAPERLLAERAADIHRHLANEPVVARPPTVAYRLQCPQAHPLYQ